MKHPYFENQEEFVNFNDTSDELDIDQNPDSYDNHDDNRHWHKSPCEFLPIRNDLNSRDKPHLGGPHRPRQNGHPPPMPPPERHRHHNGPRGFPGDDGFPFPFPPPPPQGAPFPFRKDSIRKLQHLFLLELLMNLTEGITGYSLQEKYNFPRSSIVRLLDQLVEEEHICTEETIENGRAQKLYSISEKGKEYLKDLKQEWAGKFITFTEIAPPERFGNPFSRHGPRDRMMHEIEILESKEDAVDYFRGMRSRIKHHLGRINLRTQKLQATKELIDQFLIDLEQQPTLDKEWLKSKIDSLTIIEPPPPE